MERSLIRKQISELTKQYQKNIRLHHWAYQEYLTLKHKSFATHEAEAWSNWSQGEPTSESSFSAHYSSSWLIDERKTAKRVVLNLEHSLKHFKQQIKQLQRQL